jgi:hypothetical protein
MRQKKTKSIKKKIKETGENLEKQTESRNRSELEKEQ